jgi:hypothetical protein
MQQYVIRESIEDEGELVFAVSARAARRQYRKRHGLSRTAELFM